MASRERTITDTASSRGGADGSGPLIVSGNAGSRFADNRYKDMTQIG